MAQGWPWDSQIAVKKISPFDIMWWCIQISENSYRNTDPLQKMETNANDSIYVTGNLQKHIPLFVLLIEL